MGDISTRPPRLEISFEQGKSHRYFDWSVSGTAISWPCVTTPTPVGANGLELGVASQHRDST